MPHKYWSIVLFQAFLNPKSNALNFDFQMQGLEGVNKLRHSIGRRQYLDKCTRSRKLTIKSYVDQVMSRQQQGVDAGFFLAGGAHGFFFAEYQLH